MKLLRMGVLLLAVGIARPSEAQRARAAANPLIRQTRFGAVEGVADTARAVWAWLGVPYAKPPIGRLRWRAPAPPAKWTVVRKANRFGPACAQVGGPHGPSLDRAEPYGLATALAFDQPVGSEDCLTLNLWRPATRDASLPVIVFIHGGANVAGYSADPLYHGGNLARMANAVVVTMNYRLGVFGWFMHPAMRTGKDYFTDSGNLGLLDLIQALGFVKENIARFGGDTANVTVMGQSAGAVNTYSLVVSPLSVGLFHKAIALSGALMNAPRRTQDDYADRVVQRLLIRDQLAPDTVAASQLLKSKDLGWIWSYLEKQPTGQLVLAAHQVPGGGMATADGTVSPKDIRGAVIWGQFRMVPVMTGLTAEEGKFFPIGAYRVSEAERFRMMYQCDPDASGKVALGDLLKPELARMGAFDSAAGPMTARINQLVDEGVALIQSKQPAVYAMRFDWAQQAEPWRTVIGATHAMDLPFVFHNFGRNYFSCAFGSANRAGREALSKAMIASIGAFIRTGDPNTAELGTRWERWVPVAGGPTRLILDATASEPKITMATRN
jgi:para-nitrobenzyl esterase